MKKKRGIIIIFFILVAFLILGKYLIPEVYDYIYGYFLFRWIGSNLTVNIEQDFDKAAMVAFWVFDNIKGVERNPYMPIIDDNFLNIYKRGFGYCDQSAHVYATMMYWLGFKTKLLILRKEDGTSPHTVALVKIKDKFMIVDTMYKFIFADRNKNSIGIDELRDSEVFDEYLKVVANMQKTFKLTHIEYKISWFKNGVYFETFPYMDKKKIFKKLVQKIKDKLAISNSRE